MKRLILALAIIFTALQPTLAADCYSLNAATAEALVRIHSKLMVIALSCKYAPDGTNLTDAYVSFGRKHTQELREAETTLINYYRAKGQGGVAGLDNLRTVLGNEYANEIAIADPLEFCKTAATAVTQANYWNNSQFQQAVTTQVALSTRTGVARICPETPLPVVAQPQPGFGSGGGTTGVITNIKTGADAALSK